MAMAVLLLDDGELDDVQEILEHIGVPFGRVRGGAIAPNTPPPKDLLISTPRRISMVRKPEGAADGSEPIRIVVVDGDSGGMRDQLRQVGFDYLVRRPVHPEALRLLVVHSLYTGEERRREPRLPFGFDVSFRTGLLPRRATLVELSSGGCRLHSSYRLEPQKMVRIQLPKAVGTTEVLSLEGRVVRLTWDERLGEDGMYVAGISFEDLGTDARDELDWILEERTRGPATLSNPEHSEPPLESDEPEVETADDETPAPDHTADVEVQLDVQDDVQDEEEAPGSDEATAQVDGQDEVAAEEDTAGKSATERRRSPRRSYESKVPAFGSQALRMLFGRDLSSRGMRVRGDSDIEIGDRLHLAIYGDPGEEPFLVWATVIRDDGAEGLALAFDEPHPTVAAQLDKVVANLPAVESLHDDEAAAMGSVVSEILDD